MEGEATTPGATSATSNGAGEGPKRAKKGGAAKRIRKAIRRKVKARRGAKKYPGGLCVKISGDRAARGVSVDVPVFKRFERARASIGKREGRKLSRSRAINRAIAAWLKKVGF